MSRVLPSLIFVVITLLLTLTAGTLATGQTPKKGGILQTLIIEDPPGFSIHEAATVSTLWPMMPCYSNLVLFDPLKARETVETVVPDLAERWSWQDYRNLVLFLRKNVKWHDGQPFTSRDVKYTFDVVREAKDAPAKLRLSPRKDWYANVDAIETPDPHTVIFRLRRPQPSLLLMLAAGYSPVYPAHVSPADLRQPRTTPIYMDLASFVADQLHQVGIEVNLRQLDTAQYFPALARKEYQIGANLTAPGVDDPDAALYENFRCGTARNYTQYCSEETDRLIDQQSQELSREKRLKMVWDIQKKLEADVARPILGWRKEYFTQWPHVKNLVPHHSLYNWGRMEQVWLDR